MLEEIVYQKPKGSVEDNGDYIYEVNREVAAVSFSSLKVRTFDALQSFAYWKMFRRENNQNFTLLCLPN